MKRILSTASTKGLGRETLIQAAKRYPEALIVGSSRNVDDFRAELDADFPEIAPRVLLVAADLSKNSDRTRLLRESAEFFEGEAPDLVHINLGYFDFDDEIKKNNLQGPMEMLNYTANMAFLDEMKEYFVDMQDITVLWTGSIGVIADMIGRPMPGTSLYGAQKARFFNDLNAKAKLDQGVRVVAVHPGPFGGSAQKIADKYGDTWSIPAEFVARFSLDLVGESLATKAKVLHGIIAAEQHFVFDQENQFYMGDAKKLGIDGLDDEDIIKLSDGMHLVAQ